MSWVWSEVEAEAVDASRWKLRMLYDAACPLCAREVALLRRLDRRRQRLDFEDISDPAFDAGVYGLDQATVEARMHAILPDGRAIEGVDVFERAYAEVGLGWLVVPMRWRPIRWVLERVYDVFARNRLRWTGRGAPTCEPKADGSACSIVGRGPEQEA